MLCGCVPPGEAMQSESVTAGPGGHQGCAR